MKKLFVCAAVCLVSLAAMTGCGSRPRHADRVGRSFVARWENPDSIHWRGQRNHFSWQAGYIMYAMEKMWRFTGDPVYFDYIKRYVDQQVDSVGNIPDFRPTALDNFAPGYAILLLYEQTGEERYRRAAETISRAFDDYPRTDCGLFWHSRSMYRQAWVDGVYMGQLFLARYGRSVGDSDYAFGEVVRQMTLIEEKCGKENGLLLHAWDESGRARWADSLSGRSREVWSEGLGWYAVLIADVFDFLPEEQPGREHLLEVLRRLCAGLKASQDPRTGMWCQVVDKCDSAGNWNETSGTGMFVYLLQKAIDDGYIPAGEYQPVVDRAYAGLVGKAVERADGAVDIVDCSSIGVQTDYRAYVSKPREVSPFTGFGSFMIGAGIVEYGSEKLR